jgi:hypothetical protein
MSILEWDYSPILERLATETTEFAAVLAKCHCGETLTAVSTTVALCDKRILEKYRRHAREYPAIHPIPGSTLAAEQVGGWTSGTCL